MYGGDDMRVPLLPALCLAGLLCLTACGTQAEPTPTPAPAGTTPPPAACQPKAPFQMEPRAAGRAEAWVTTTARVPSR